MRALLPVMPFVGCIFLFQFSEGGNMVLAMPPELGDGVLSSFPL